jgi:prophage regulatory protein
MAAAELPATAPRILRLPHVEVLTGLKKTSIYDMAKAGKFPRSVPLGPKARGWLECEVTQWIESRTAERAA